MIGYMLFVFFSGIAIGSVIGGFRLRAKMRLYRHFIEERLSAVNSNAVLRIPLPAGRKAQRVATPVDQFADMKPVGLAR